MIRTGEIPDALTEPDLAKLLTEALRVGSSHQDLIYKRSLPEDVVRQAEMQTSNTIERLCERAGIAPDVEKIDEFALNQLGAHTHAVTQAIRPLVKLLGDLQCSALTYVQCVMRDGKRRGQLVLVSTEPEYYNNLNQKDFQSLLFPALDWSQVASIGMVLVDFGDVKVLDNEGLYRLPL